jgi:hypothetical protein
MYLENNLRNLNEKNLCENYILHKKSTSIANVEDI